MTNSRLWNTRLIGAYFFEKIEEKKVIIDMLWIENVKIEVTSEPIVCLILDIRNIDQLSISRSNFTAIETNSKLFDIR